MHYPKMLDQVDDDIARAVLDTLQAAAEAQALPGFDGDPRGMGVVEMWRRKRFGEDGIEKSFIGLTEEKRRTS